MSGNRERIGPEDLNSALNDPNSVVEVSLDYGALASSRGRNLKVILERSAKTPEDDRALGILPDLLNQPELFAEVMGQMDRGEITEVTQSTNPKVQQIIQQFRAKYPDAFSTERKVTPAPKPSRNPDTSALRSFGRKKPKKNR